MNCFFALCLVQTVFGLLKLILLENIIRDDVLGSMGMDFLFNPDFGMGQSHFYRKGGIKTPIL